MFISRIYLLVNTSRRRPCQLCVLLYFVVAPGKSLRCLKQWIPIDTAMTKKMGSFMMSRSVTCDDCCGDSCEGFSGDHEENMQFDSYRLLHMATKEKGC